MLIEFVRVRYSISKKVFISPAWVVGEKVLVKVYFKLTRRRRKKQIVKQLLRKANESNATLDFNTSRGHHDHVLFVQIEINRHAHP